MLGLLISLVPSLPLVLFSVPDDSRAISVAEISGIYGFAGGVADRCSLRLSENGRCALRWAGCAGSVKSFEGVATVEKDQLTIRPDDPTANSGLFALPVRYRCIRWEKRVYLVPLDRGLDFCNEVNSGFEPRKSLRGSFFLRQNDWKIDVNEPPCVPLEWRRWLAKSPLDGRVTQVLEKGRAKLNLGHKEGVQIGMELWLKDEFAPFVVISVDEVSCVVNAKYDDLGIDSIRVGSELSTRLR